MKSEEIFAHFLAEIAEQVSQNTYLAWFAPLELVSIINNVITIKVPMRVHKQMLSETYQDVINSVFINQTGINYTFKYLTEDELEEIKPDIIEVLNDENSLNWETNLNPKFSFDTYVVGNSNRLAFAAAKAVAEAPGTIHNPLFIYGRSGIGKTHLMHSIGNYIKNHSNLKVLYTTSHDYMTDYTGIASKEKGSSSIKYANDFKNKYQNVDVLIIDDIQFLVGAEMTQTEFFQTFNYLHQNNKQIIISSDRSPNDLKKIEERLRSRFMWGLPVDIFPPDFNLRCNIIREKIKNTSIDNKLTDDVIEYIANSCVNDVRHIEGTINRLLAYTAMMVPEVITLEFALEALNDYVNTNIFINNSIESIQRTVADYFNITIDDLKSKKRTTSVVRPRHIAMYLCRKETNENLSKIGLEFGGRDHSTVSTALEKLKEELKTDTNLERIIKEIKIKLQ
ncbi:MAG: chromosomal replication initiator protein DnaA [Firmicutes bacterium]|nr:chromosomal replication initiator protein DnaA [Bacillota bacterium]